jgi:hypothetical protein
MLLQPSLSGSGLATRAPYSKQMLFIAAFFGGPLAALLGFGLNLQRLGLWRRDGLPFAVVSLIGLALWPWAAAWSTVGTRLLALSLLGLGVWRHRREHAGADLMLLSRPSGWGAGFALVLLGNLGDFLLHVLLSKAAP